MKKIMWTISLTALLGTALALQCMPENLPMQYDAAGHVSRWGPKAGYLILPVIALSLSALWACLIGYSEKKARDPAGGKASAGAGTNAGVLCVAGVSTAALFAGLQGFLLYRAYGEAVSGAAGQTVEIGKISVILLGALLIALGNFLTKTRINGAVGVRTGWSMYSDSTWKKSNRFGAFAMMATGALTVSAAVFAKSALGAEMTALGLIAAMCIASVAYARRVYLRERDAEKEEKH